jgi:hypothetical protein
MIYFCYSTFTHRGDLGTRGGRQSLGFRVGEITGILHGVSIFRPEPLYGGSCSLPLRKSYVHVCSSAIASRCRTTLKKDLNRLYNKQKKRIYDRGMLMADANTTHVALQGLEKSPTGIGGLDEITDGGLPKGRPTLISGGAGSGKTLMSMQFLAQGALRYDEPGVFVAFEESAEELWASLEFFRLHEELYRRY